MSRDPHDVPVKVTDLQPGDKVDLEQDEFYDPEGENITAEYEYGIVVELHPETADCIVVDFDNFESCGWPPDHTVYIERRRVCAGCGQRVDGAVGTLYTLTTLDRTCPASESGHRL